ncbi:hypothetical protein B7494_g656 [Chlorociboria aeruginascens]|nr:hypothetical protein B7494_g656 [Chlorociboria aeruginascens]
MGDRLTQLQDAVDELATQFVACLHYIHKHHDLETLGPTDVVRKKEKKEGEPPDLEDQDVEPHPSAEFKAGQRELAQDLIFKEQQIEYLISMLPGLENSEKDQEQTIKQLEEELNIEEDRRKEAVKEKEAVQARLDNVIRSVKRP